jgi:hypothetical protein
MGAMTENVINIHDYGAAPEPIPDFPGFVVSMLRRGYTLNPCRDNCPEDGEHAHLHSPPGGDGIVWADGKVSEFDLTQPARLIYPTYGQRRPRGAPPAGEWPAACYTMPSGSMVHIRSSCRCKT